MKSATERAVTVEAFVLACLTYGYETETYLRHDDMWQVSVRKPKPRHPRRLRRKDMGYMAKRRVRK